MRSTEDRMELQPIRTNGSDGAANLSEVRVDAAGKGDGVACMNPEAPESEALLLPQSTNSNGALMPSNHAAGNQRNNGSAHNAQETSAVCRIKDELNEVIFWKVRLWMIILFILVLIIGVILLTLFLCSVIYEDPDENFDPSTFKVLLHFNGSFELPNMVFTEELLNPSSNESQVLATDLREKLGDLYRSSPALGRYFSAADILAFRNSSVVADFWLKFVMPEEEQEQLRNFTLSRKMVFNVFRQFLYDQELDVSQHTYIDPQSLRVSLSH